MYSIYLSNTAQWAHMYIIFNLSEQDKLNINKCNIWYIAKKKNKIIQWTLIASWQRCRPEARTLLHKLLELVLSCSKSMESWPWIFLIDWVKSKTINFVDNLVQFKSTSRPWIMLINWLSVNWKFSTKVSSSLSSNYL